MTSLAGTKHSQVEITYGSQGSTPDAHTDAHTWFVLWENNIMPFLCSTYILDHVDIVLNRSGNLQEATSVDAPVAGGLAVEAAPPQVAVVLKKHTGVLGRHGRGRMYIPGVPMNDFQVDDPGALTPTQFANWNTYAAALYNQCLTAQLPMALISRHQWNLPPLDYHFLGLTGLSAVVRSGTQRRRNRKAAHR